MALLQTIMNQCISYEKDPWKGPIGKDGKVSRNPLVNAAHVSSSASSNPYEALANLLFRKHLNHWRYNCKVNSEKCLVCHNTSQDKPHNAKDCPISKKIGLELVKCSLADTNAMSQVGNDAPLPAQPSAPAPALLPLDNGGLGPAPGTFTVVT
jgi:hypothetical protein